MLLWVRVNQLNLSDMSFLLFSLGRLLTDFFLCHPEKSILLTGCWINLLTSSRDLATYLG